MIRSSITCCGRQYFVSLKGESSDMLLTTREAAHLLNVSCRTLQRMRSEQRIALKATYNGRRLSLALKRGRCQWSIMYLSF